MTLLDFNDEFAATERARSRARRILDQYDHLPAAGEGPRFEKDGARIVVASREDLGAWLDTIGGEVTAQAGAGGFEQWLLTARVEDWRGGPPVQVRVALVVIAGEWDLSTWLQCLTAEAVA